MSCSHPATLARQRRVQMHLTLYIIFAQPLRQKVFQVLFFYFFILGGVTNTGDDKWPPLDNYQAPYREPILAPTTNSLTNSNGIISILPAPAKFNMQTNRLPRNIFYPSVLMNPSKPAQVSFSLDWSKIWNVLQVQEFLVSVFIRISISKKIYHISINNLKIHWITLIVVVVIALDADSFLNFLLNVS